MKYEEWEDVDIGRIALIVRVTPSFIVDEHVNRPTHGLVINEPNGLRDYYFSDGTVMHTCGNQLFYLPKGSTYKVIPKTDVENSGCYAINFDAAISDESFAIDLRAPEPMFKSFKKAEVAWREHGPFWQTIVKRSIYDIILQAFNELSKSYVPNAKENIVSPAIKIIRASFNDPGLEVAPLAKVCGISEAYFRRLFAALYGKSPKAYITDLRMDYAKKLIESGEFSISRVGAMCGFTDPCYFSREFAKVVGVCPSKYVPKIK